MLCRLLSLSLSFSLSLHRQKRVVRRRRRRGRDQSPPGRANVLVLSASSCTRATSHQSSTPIRWKKTLKSSFAPLREGAVVREHSEPKCPSVGFRVTDMSYTIPLYCCESKKEERLCEHVFGVVQLIQLLYNNNNKTRATKKNFSDDARAVKCYFFGQNVWWKVR